MLDGVGRATLSATQTKSGRSGLRRVEERPSSSSRNRARVAERARHAGVGLAGGEPAPGAGPAGAGAPPTRDGMGCHPSKGAPCACQGGRVPVSRPLLTMRGREPFPPYSGVWAELPPARSDHILHKAGRTFFLIFFGHKNHLASLEMASRVRIEVLECSHIFFGRLIGPNVLQKAIGTHFGKTVITLARSIISRSLKMRWKAYSITYNIVACF